MKRYIQHEYLKVSHFTTAEWEHPVHNHNHFELIFIHKGGGTHCVSGMNIPYTGPCLFLLAPCDAHHFEITAPTTFTFIKFTNVYLHGSGNMRLQQSWNQELDQLLLQARQKRMITENIHRMEPLIRLVAAEWKENSDTVFFLLQALFTMIRQVTEHELPSAAPKSGARVTHILNYIHEHIHQAGDIQVEQLAERFGYSKHYLGAFFKEQTGSTLRDYMNQYKLQLLENRLHYSVFSLKEISHELGFNDQSHLNKFFRRYHHMSPSAYREQVQAGM